MSFNPDKYENKLPYPDRHKTRERLRRKIDETPMTAAQRKLALDGLPEAVKQACKPEADAYAKEEQRLRLMFFKDAETFHGFQDLPESVRDKLHSMAWEQGHSGGYSEVWNCYLDISDLAVLAYTEGQKP